MAPRPFRPPAVGDKILVVRRPWLELLLSGEKTLEVRPWRIRPSRPGGRVYLGCRGVVHAQVYFGEPVLVPDEAGWSRLRPHHRVPAGLPYKNTYVHDVLELVPARHAVRYVHPRGAVGIFRYCG